MNLTPPLVLEIGPADSFMIELLIFYGRPFKDHRSFWARSQNNPDVGVAMPATIDVRNGFVFEIKRSHDIGVDDHMQMPSERIPLQWVNGEYFDEQAMPRCSTTESTRSTIILSVHLKPVRIKCKLQERA